MNLLYAFVADSAVLGADGKLTAVGVFDVIRATDFPVVQRDMSLVAQVAGSMDEKGSHKLRVEFRESMATTNLAVLDMPFSMETQGATQGILRAGIVVRMMDFPIPSAGQYEFVLFANDRFLGRVVVAAKRLVAEKSGEA